MGFEKQIEDAKKLVAEAVKNPLITPARAAVANWLRILADQVSAGRIVGFEGVTWEGDDKIRGVTKVFVGEVEFTEHVSTVFLKRREKVQYASEKCRECGAEGSDPCTLECKSQRGRSDIVSECPVCRTLGQLCNVHCKLSVKTDEVDECLECGSIGSQCCTPDCKVQRKPDQGEEE